MRQIAPARNLADWDEKCDFLQKRVFWSPFSPHISNMNIPHTLNLFGDITNFGEIRNIPNIGWPPPFPMHPTIETDISKNHSKNQILPESDRYMTFHGEFEFFWCTSRKSTISLTSKMARFRENVEFDRIWSVTHIEPWFRVVSVFLSFLRIFEAKSTYFNSSQSAMEISRKNSLFKIMASWRKYLMCHIL